MKLLIFALSLNMLIGFSASAQESGDVQTKYVEIFSTGYDGSQMAFHIRPEGRYTEIKGSPYLNEAWCDGMIRLRDDSIGSTFLMRYNVYANEMQFISSHDTFAISNPLRVYGVWLAGKRFEYLPFTYNNNENMAWFEVLSEGRLKLLVRHSSRMETGMDPLTPYHCQNSVDRFVSGRYLYYQTIEMDSPAELPSGKGSFLAISEFSSPEVKDFIRSHKLNILREKDLQTLFSWINNSTIKK